MRANTKSKVIAADSKTTFDLKPHMEIATRRAIKTVKIINNGKAYLLKKLVQQPMIRDTASIPTVTIMMTGVWRINWLNRGLL